MAGIALGAEVFIDRSATALVLARALPGEVVDVELQPLITGSAAEEAIVTLQASYPDLAVVVDPKSPSATLLEPLQRAGVTVTKPDAAALAVAHGCALDLIKAGRLRHHGQAELTGALQHAQGRKLAGGHAVDRYGSPVDPAPWTAAELAIWGLLRAGPPDPFVLYGR